MATRRAQDNKKKTAVTLINGGTTPAVYTDDGHVLAAGERVEVDKIDATAQALVERGYLMIEGDPEPQDGDRDEQEAPGASDPESTS